MTTIETTQATETTGGVDELVGPLDRNGILDDHALREIRRAVLTAVAVPGYQVPFGSREMPVARGWGSGGLQITLALTGPDDVVKVIDQGDDEGVNAVNLRRLVVGTTRATETTEPDEATIIQTRHRIPEDELTDGQILVLQVPVPEPLRGVERDMRELARMHAEADYARMWVSLYEDKVRNGVITRTTGYPCLVGKRVTIGHAAVVHGATVGDHCLVGIGAVARNGSAMGEGSWLAAGAVLGEGRSIPPWTIAVGIPAKPLRELTDEERDRARRGVDEYLEFGAAYREKFRG